ncbi:MAG: hypothetical protein RLW62_07775, partial [Gammaproteobacteria bacterium]
MNQPRFLAALVAALLASPGAPAFQLGQVRSGSHQGEPLTARVELFGLDRAAAGRLALELRPDITAPYDSPARAAVAAMTARVAADASGQPYILLQSTAPLALAELDFRLQARHADLARTAHLHLALPPARRTRSARALPDGVETYGPVRRGESLWGILAANGLASGNPAATIAAVVAANPHAFVGGDADRLRVGVVLSLPRAAGVRARPVARAAPTPVPAPTSPRETPAAPPRKAVAATPRAPADRAAL